MIRQISRKFIVIWFICILISLQAISGLSNHNVAKIPVIIDSDGAPDDVYAILYLLKHLDYEVIGLTLSCGVGHVNQSAQNYVNLLSYLEYESIPVAAGKETPLLANFTFPDAWRQATYGFFGLDLPEAEQEVSDLDAHELIISLVSNAEQQVIIAALGPLTNVAMALEQDPSIKENIALLNIMGGAVNVDGNVGYESNIPNYAAEWNLYVDPHAADIVFRSGLDMLLVPLDATNYVPITQAFKTKLGEEMQTPEAEIVHFFLDTNLYFWDILAVIAMTNPEVVTTEEYHLVIDTETVNQEGKTSIADGEPPNAEVAIHADKEAFEDQFILIVNTPDPNDGPSSSNTGFLEISIPIVIIYLFVPIYLCYRKKT